MTRKHCSITTTDVAVPPAGPSTRSTIIPTPVAQSRRSEMQKTRRGKTKVARRTIGRGASFDAYTADEVER